MSPPLFLPRQTLNLIALNPNSRVSRMLSRRAGLRPQASTKKTLFGSTIELGYELDLINLSHLSFAGMAYGDFLLFTSRPYISLTHSLWQNGSGRATTAQYEQLEAQGQAQALQAKYAQESLFCERGNCLLGAGGRPRADSDLRTKCGSVKKGRRLECPEASSQPKRNERLPSSTGGLRIAFT